MLGEHRTNTTRVRPRPVAGTFRVYLPCEGTQTESGFKSKLLLLTFVNVIDIIRPSHFFNVSVFFSRDPLCIRCFRVREVGSGAGLVWHAWLGRRHPASLCTRAWVVQVTDRFFFLDGVECVNVGLEWCGAVAVGVWSVSPRTSFGTHTHHPHTRYALRHSLSLVVL